MATKGAIGVMYEQAVDRLVSAANEIALVYDIPTLGFGHIGGKRGEFRHVKELETLAEYMERVASISRAERRRPTPVQPRPYPAERNEEPAEPPAIKVPPKPPEPKPIRKPKKERGK